MPTKFHQGIYQPINVNKYVGKNVNRIIFRSSYENSVMRFLDNHPAVQYWASESYKIPYVNPLTGKKTFYIPDFFIVYDDSQGKRHVEIVEVKPSTQIVENAKTSYDKAQAAINEAKWKAARYWCKQKGISFRVITENEIYNKPSKTGKRRRRR